jgi:hypothetical protein
MEQVLENLITRYYAGVPYLVSEIPFQIDQVVAYAKQHLTDRFTVSITPISRRTDELVYTDHILSICPK